MLGKLFLCLLAATACLGEVEKLTELHDQMKGLEYWIVAFTKSDTQEGYKKFLSELASVDNVLKGQVKVGEADTAKELDTNSTVRTFVEALKVKQFPAIYIFSSHALWRSGRGEIPTLYKGNNTASAITKYIQSNIPSRLVNRAKSVTEIDMFKYSTHDNLPAAILFHNDTVPHLSIRVASINYHDRMLFYDVKHTGNKTKNYLEKFNITELPTVLVVTPRTTFTGNDEAYPQHTDLAYPALASFLDEHATTTESRDALRKKHADEYEAEEKKKRDEEAAKRYKKEEAERKDRLEKARKRAEWEQPFVEAAQAQTALDGELVVVADDIPAEVADA